MVQALGGIKLFTQNYFVKSPKANVLITHGLAEHCGRYAYVAESFNKIDCNVYTYDLRGHGRSEGDKAFISNFDEYRQDLEIVYNTIPKGLPIFVLGHSMGGLISFNFLQFRERPDIKGVILSGAALAVGKNINPFTQKIISILAQFAPRLPTVKLNAKILTNDPEEIEKAENDPLIYHKGTKAGLGNVLLNAILAANTHFKGFKYPVLIMHGQADTLANPQGSEDLYKQCISSDKTLKLWKGAFHEIFNETNRKEILDYTSNWLKKRI